MINDTKDCCRVENPERLAPKYDMAVRAKHTRSRVYMNRKCKMSARAESKVSDSIESGREKLKNWKTRQ